MSASHTSARSTFLEKLKERILVLDGAMGTMIQALKLDEEGYRGARFDAWNREVRGNNDLLNLSRPDAVRDIHLAYFRAGADIVSTNTFSSTKIAQADYGMEGIAYELNHAGAKLAREAAALAEKEDGRRRFVAGALGPTNRTASISPDVSNPGFRAITFRPAARGLWRADQGSDRRRRGFAADRNHLRHAQRQGGDLRDCRSLRRARHRPAGDDLGHHHRPLRPAAVGPDAGGVLECGAARQSGHHRASIARSAPRKCAPISPKSAASPILSCAPIRTPGCRTNSAITTRARNSWRSCWANSPTAGLVNVVGGCCGTTPEHIAAIAKAVAGKSPRKIPELPRQLRLSGLEAFTLTPEIPFVNIGERTNVTGSAKFRKLITAGDYAAALSIAREQVENGAQVIDVNMDEGLLDSEAAMVTFLNLIAAEPDIARVPVMVDSSKFSVIEAGLKCLQGKPVVNSISMKEGEAAFIEHAKIVRRYGAAVVVMAFDEKGQADTFERKTTICKRAYDILTTRSAFRPKTSFSIPTSSPSPPAWRSTTITASTSSRRRAGSRPTCRTCMCRAACRTCRSRSAAMSACARPCIRCSCIHAIKAGMDMGIVNAGQIAVYDDLDPELREACEDVVLNRRPDASERLLALAEKFRGAGQAAKEVDLAWRERPVEKRLGARAGARHHRFHRGRRRGSAHARHAAARCDRRPADGRHEHRRRSVRLRQNVSAAGGEIRAGDEAGGRLSDAVHGEGKRRAPAGGRRGRTLVQRQDRDGDGQGRRARHRQEHRRRRAPVQQLRGDRSRRHGAGGEDSGNRARREGRHHRPVRADHAVARRDVPRRGRDGAAGLRAAADDRRRHHQPRAHGGEDPSELQARPGGLCERRQPRGRRGAGADVGEGAGALRRRAARRICQDRRRACARAGRKDAAAARRRARAMRSSSTGRGLCAAEAELHRHQDAGRLSDRRAGRFHRLDAVLPDLGTERQIPRHSRRREIRARPRARSTRTRAPCCDKIVAERWFKASAVVGFWPANAQGDDIQVFADEARDTPVAVLHSLRQQLSKREGRANEALADFVAPRDSGLADYIGAFTVTAGIGEDEIADRFKRANDDYSAIMVKALADRLAEAFAERLHAARAQGILGLRSRRGADQRRTDRREISRHPPGARLSGAARPHREGHAVPIAGQPSASA